MKHLLMVAYHFPPIAGSSGVHRTLQFARHLPDLGWQPVILSISPRAYERTADELLADIPPGVRVVRAFGLDAAKHLSIAGRYPSWLARPDRWASWIPAGIIAGRKLVTRFRPAALWSTFPIASAHRIALSLHASTALPWIADFRDPMAQPDYPADPRQRARLAQLEARIAAAAAATTFTAPGAHRNFAKRHPGAASSAHVIENGYDEDSFPTLGENSSGPLNPGCLTLLHSGIVYPDERDPTALMQALAQIKAAEPRLATRLRVRFRAPVHVEHLTRLVARSRLDDIVEIMPALPYRQALEEMLRADGLLLLQAANCEEQIPAKLYEYLRAGRPIIGLTSPTGDTAQVLKRHGVARIAGLSDAPAIERTLAGFLRQPSLEGQSHDRDAGGGCSRKCRTMELEALLDRATGPQRRAASTPS